MASVYKTLNNGKEQWCSAWATKSDAGKRIYVRGYGKTRHEAIMAMERNIAKRMSSGDLSAEYVPDVPAPAADGEMTVEEVMEQWLIHLRADGVQDSSRSKYRSELTNHLLPSFGKMSVAQLTEEHLMRHFHEVLPDEKGVGSSARFHAWKSTNAMLRFAMRKKLLKENPLAHVPKPKHISRVSEEDKRHTDKRLKYAPYLLAWLSDEENPYHYYYPLVLMLFMGLRRGEALGLQWDAITGMSARAREGSVYIHRQLALYSSESGKEGFYISDRVKNGKPRRVPLPSGHRTALWKHKQRGIVATNPDFKNSVFLSPTGGLLTPARLAEIWKEILVAYATKDGGYCEEWKVWRLHANRHIAASVLLEQGVAIETIQEILGHSDAAQSLHYAKVARAATEKAARQLEFGLATPKNRKKNKKKKKQKL